MRTILKPVHRQFRLHLGIQRYRVSSLRAIRPRLEPRPLNRTSQQRLDDRDDRPLHLREVVPNGDVRSWGIEVLTDEVGDGDDVSGGGCPGDHVHLAEGDVQGLDVLEEVGGGLVGDGAVVERADALFAGHDVFGDAVRAGILQEFVGREVEEDIIRAVGAMAGTWVSWWVEGMDSRGLHEHPAFAGDVAV